MAADPEKFDVAVLEPGSATMRTGDSGQCGEVCTRRALIEVNPGGYVYCGPCLARLAALGMCFEAGMADARHSIPDVAQRSPASRDSHLTGDDR